MLVSPQVSDFARLKPLPLGAVQITGGFWSKRQEMNGKVSLRDGYEKLQRAGNFDNLRMAAGQLNGTYNGPLYMDSDLYKWLEAVAWELGSRANSGPDSELEGWLDETTALIAAAQQPDGYLNSYYQVVAPEKRWTNLSHGHELYCAGHLIQAAIAAHRATGKTQLMEVACRFADYIDSVFGPGKENGYPGHPEIEMALVELYRETSERRYLDLSKAFIDRRGQQRMRGISRWHGPEYMQDRVPFREAQEVEGHAVRQLYLTTGAVDLYLETGEAALMEASQRLWWNATRKKMHLIGGYGARFDGETFGGNYELPSDRCYCETCAAIAAMMWNWRLLLATGDAKFADTLERSLYNNFISSISLDGTRYFYTNILHSRGGVERNAWFDCACCPPNIMRQTATLQYYAATQDAQGVQIHQYFSSRIQTAHAALAVQTDYPWEGEVKVRVEATQPEPWRLSFRIPGWATGATISVNGKNTNLAVRPGSYTVIERTWRAGDVVDVLLPLRPRLTAANPRVDALRNSLAIERGPMVYCLEAPDQPAGLNLLDARIDPAAPLRDTWRPDLFGGVIVVEVQGGTAEPVNWDENLYLPAVETPRTTAKPVKLTAIPYYAWANRGPQPMRVWVPR